MPERSSAVSPCHSPSASAGSKARCKVATRARRHSLLSAPGAGRASRAPRLHRRARGRARPAAPRCRPADANPAGAPRPRPASRGPAPAAPPARAAWCRRSDQAGNRRDRAGGAGDPDRMGRRRALPGARLRVQQCPLPRGHVPSPDSASQRGQASVTIARKRSVSSQCAAKPVEAAPGSRGARSISARAASSSSWARSRASSQARSAAVGAPPAPHMARIIRLSTASRSCGSTAGGRSSAPARASGVSSIPPNAVIRGSSSGRPPAARRNASASARAARRVGSRISPSAGASPVEATQSAASVSRNGRCGGMFSMRITADPAGPASR